MDTNLTGLIQNEIAKRICDNPTLKDFTEVRCHINSATIILQLDHLVRVIFTLNRNDLCVDIPALYFTRFGAGYAEEGFDPAKLEEALIRISKMETLNPASLRDAAVQLCAGLNIETYHDIETYHELHTK